MVWTCMDGLVCLGGLGQTALRQMLDRFQTETAPNNSSSVCKVFMMYHMIYMDVSNADDLVVVVFMKPNSTCDTSRSLRGLISHSPVLIVSIFVKE